MRILLVGDPQSRFVIDYPVNFLKHAGDGVSFHLYMTNQPLNGEKPFPFEKVFTFPCSPVLSRFVKLKYLVRSQHLKNFLKSHQDDYHVVHFLYVLQDLALMVKTLEGLRPRIILTVFGSDFMKLSTNRRGLMKPVFFAASKITFANNRTMNIFQDNYQYPKEKLALCRFGLEPLEFLQKLASVSQKQSRVALGLPTDKIIVCIGYNSNSNQQHLSVIQAIKEQTELLQRKEELYFVFPLTYGNEPQYLEKLLEALTEFPFGHVAFRTYLSEENNAHLRKVPDIFIQVQKNDQFSGSMQESLYAGNVVITGSWLPYQTFLEEGVHFCQVSDVNEIGEKLLACIQNLDEEKMNCRLNPGIIYNLSSWEKTIGSWMELYQ